MVITRFKAARMRMTVTETMVKVRRTHGLFPTVSDTTVSQWHDASFSGKHIWMFEDATGENRSICGVWVGGGARNDEEKKLNTSQRKFCSVLCMFWTKTIVLKLVHILYWLLTCRWPAKHTPRIRRRTQARTPTMTPSCARLWDRGNQNISYSVRLKNTKHIRITKIISK